MTVLLSVMPNGSRAKRRSLCATESTSSTSQVTVNIPEAQWWPRSVAPVRAVPRASRAGSSRPTTRRACGVQQGPGHLDRGVGDARRASRERHSDLPRMRGVRVKPRPFVTSGLGAVSNKLQFPRSSRDSMTQLNAIACMVPNSSEERVTDSGSPALSMMRGRHPATGLLFPGNSRSFQAGNRPTSSKVRENPDSSELNRGQPGF